MRKVDPAPFAGFIGEPRSSDLGVRPTLVWLPIRCLRIDPAYQREVLKNGARNIGKIAMEFDWAKFGVVIVANLGTGMFAIVDGQHRAIAAAARGISEVPCLVIEADPGKQAEAFASINGAVTKISPLQIFHAEVAASKPEAIALRDACAEADVSICKYPVPASKMHLGQTLAVGTLKKALTQYGRDGLALALRCITKTGPQNVGMLNEPIIKAVCHVLDAEPSWCRVEYVLIEAMCRFDFAAHLHEAEVAAKQQRTQVAQALALRLFDFLDEEIGA